MTQQLAVKQSALNPITTREQAIELLQKCWPGAPDSEIFRAAVICKDYGLHPLMGHIFLIPFKDKWATVMSIKATRLIAARKRRFSYIDDSPRMMTEAEQKKIFGKVDTANIWSITVLRDREGMEYRGYGCYPKGDKPYGMDKGNTPENMAHIRSERKAIDRAVPDTLPDVPEVIDSEYVEMPELNEVQPEISERVIDQETGEIIESEPEREPGKHDYVLKECSLPDHGGVLLTEDKYGQFTHRIDGNNYCHAVKDKIKQIAADVCGRQVITGPALNELCKEKYNGKTFSQLTQRQQVDLLNELDK